MPVMIEKSFITYETAVQLIAAAISHAIQIKLTISVAIVDPVGELVAFGRMNNCSLIGIGSSQRKAYTAARGCLSTRDFQNFLKNENISTNNLQSEKLMFIPGGLPIIYNGKVIGGIGIGGGTGEQDEACAKAAIAYCLSDSNVVI